MGFTNIVGTGEVCDVCLCLGGVGGVGGEWVSGIDPGSMRVRWCYVCVCCESELFVYNAGPDICILC